MTSQFSRQHRLLPRFRPSRHPTHTPSRLCSHQIDTSPLPIVTSTNRFTCPWTSSAQSRPSSRRRYSHMSLTSPTMTTQTTITYSCDCGPSTPRHMVRQRNRVSAASLAGNYVTSPIGLHGKQPNLSNSIQWQRKKCMALPFTLPTVQLSFVNTGIIPSNAMVPERHGIVAMAPRAQHHNSNWQTHIPVASNNRARAYTSPFVLSKASPV
jgi:hypothetical protein